MCCRSLIRLMVKMQTRFLVINFWLLEESVTIPWWRLKIGLQVQPFRYCIGEVLNNKNGQCSCMIGKRMRNITITCIEPYGEARTNDSQSLEQMLLDQNSQGKQQQFLYRNFIWIPSFIGDNELSHVLVMNILCLYKAFLSTISQSSLDWYPHNVRKYGIEVSRQTNLFSLINIVLNVCSIC